MGYAISWIAVRGIPKSEVCERLSIRDTGEPDEANESPVSGAVLPNGWHVLFLNDITHPFVSASSLQSLAVDCEVVGCQVEEHVMFSAAFFYAQGTLVWNVSHEAESGATHLQTHGLLPDALGAIHQRNLAAQRQSDEADDDVDHVFETPLELAEHLCGYKHDRWEFDWGEPAFTKYVSASR